MHGVAGVLAKPRLPAVVTSTSTPAEAPAGNGGVRGCEAGGGLDMSAWGVGVRVTTRCCLAGVDKTEHPEGATGCVWKVLPDGVLLICLDNAACEVVIVRAEPCDVVPRGRLTTRTRVRCREMVLSTNGKQRTIPRGAEGTITGYVERTNKYSVKIPALMVLADVPAEVVQPVLGRQWKLRQWLGRLAPGSGGRAGGEGGGLGLAPQSPPGLLLSMSDLNASGGSYGAADRERTTSALALSGVHANLSEVSLHASVRNLTKTPSYSNIMGSPRSVRRSTRRGSASTVSFDPEPRVDGDADGFPPGDIDACPLTPDSPAGPSDASVSFASTHSEAPTPEPAALLESPTLAKRAPRGARGKGLVGQTSFVLEHARLQN